jgi:uncharacterized protein YkwD
MMARVVPARLVAALALLLCAAVILPATAAADSKPRAAQTCAGAELVPAPDNLAAARAAVLCLHNRERAARGLPRLREQRQLRAAAQAHAEHMVEAQFFAHDDPDGGDFAARILDTGYGRNARWSLGENIAYASGDGATVAQIHRMWMDSPGHRANILQRRFREIGIGIALGSPDGEDAGATYAADFGVRR